MAKVSHLHMHDVKGFGSAFDTKTWANNLYKSNANYIFGGISPAAFVQNPADNSMTCKKTAEWRTAKPWMKTTRSLRKPPSNGWKGDARLRMCAYAWFSQPV